MVNKYKFFKPGNNTIWFSRAKVSRTNYRCFPVDAFIHNKTASKNCWQYCYVEDFITVRVIDDQWPGFAAGAILVLQALHFF